MTNEKIETAIHRNEVAQIEAQKQTPEFRALCIKNAGEALAGYGETLRLAALGQLTVGEPDIFGDVASIEKQVADANFFIQRQFEMLAKYA